MVTDDRAHERCAHCRHRATLATQGDVAELATTLRQLPELVRLLRTDLGLTTAEAAVEAGSSAGTIWRVEAGLLPNGNTCLKLIEWLVRHNSDQVVEP